MKLSSIRAALLLAACAVAPAVHANDTTAQLGTGGLVFVTNENIQMASEDLFVSPTEVKVVYKFHNKSDKDQHILIAFPMPDIEGSGDFMVGIPTEDPENIFGFATTFNGAPVEATLHQYAFANNIDYSADLKKLGVPLAPFGEATYAALNALPDADKQRLGELGLVFGMEYDAGEGPQVDTTPIWTLRSTYSWEATFPAGEDVDVVHTYKPSVGGTVATTFLPRMGDEYATKQLADYKTKYCVDDTLIKTLEKSRVKMDGYDLVPYYENWISYIWSTGNNWSGPIGKFTLTIDKGDPKNLVSFCGDNVKKIGPTTFQTTATDWFPPYGQELEVLLLVPQAPQ